MAVIFSDSGVDLNDACMKLAALLPLRSRAPREDVMWQCRVPHIDLQNVLGRVQGVARIAFKSRDCQFAFVGFGAADKIKSNDRNHLDELVEKSARLFPGQIYCGAIRFDDSMRISPEWQAFGKRWFILPLLYLSQKNGVFTVSLNYRHDHVPFDAWLDFAQSLLEGVRRDTPEAIHSFAHNHKVYLPERDGYASTIHRALGAFKEQSASQKVVIGRRHSIELVDKIDPYHLFIRLAKKSRGAFLFFVDCGQSNAFFGISPELLYRRVGRTIETESLAGTRARSLDEEHDQLLRSELAASFKDNREHALVSLHIEEKLKDLAVTELICSKLDVMALTYVQHLVRRYRGVLGANVNDAHVIEALHPTPAVCGLDVDWARSFIEQHEGFDRGFYAGPIGYIGKDEAEFAVAIRSALTHEKMLHVYAACGIVSGSVEKQEWEELNNKEKSILSIFHDEE